MGEKNRCPPCRHIKSWSVRRGKRRCAACRYEWVPRGHVNGLEGFWGYLKRRLAAKGGVRRERLPLYLAEYVWRYNHRRLSGPEQVKALLKLLQS